MTQPTYKIHVTRDASVTYTAEVQMDLKDIKSRMRNHGFTDDGLNLDWEESNVSAYDNVERYEVTKQVQRTINGKTVTDEVTVYSEDRS